MIVPMPLQLAARCAVRSVLHTAFLCGLVLSGWLSTLNVWCWQVTKGWKKAEAASQCDRRLCGEWMACNTYPFDWEHSVSGIHHAGRLAPRPIVYVVRGAGVALCSSPSHWVTVTWGYVQWHFRYLIATACAYTKPTQSAAAAVAVACAGSPRRCSCCTAKVIILCQCHTGCAPPFWWQHSTTIGLQQCLLTGATVCW